MRKSSIYTRAGDSGLTGLVSGTRIRKDDSRLDLYGEVDDLNSKVGYAVSLMRGQKIFEDELIFLEEIQGGLFNLGSNLACEKEQREKWNLPTLTQDHVETLERHIDRLDSELTPLKTFILPGGSITGAALHLCRTSARSVERKMVGFHHVSGEELPDFSLIWLNRLSDFFFTLARSINKQMGITEKHWKN